MLRRLVLLVAIVPLFAAAPPTPATPTDVMGAMVDELTFDHQLTLLDAGAEPRTVVRYQPRPGAVAAYETVARTNVDMSMTMPDGQTMAMPMGGAMPSVVMGMRNTVGEPTANGVVAVRIEQLGARIDGAAAPEVAEGMSASLAALDGLVFDLMIDRDGRPVQLDIVGGADSEMAGLVQQMADQMVDRMPTFPTEPIGVGARWKTNVDVSMAGMDMAVSQTMVARKITADSIDFDMVMELAVAEGAITLPGMPPGMAPPEITKFVGSGKGTMHMDLGTIVATGTSVMDMDMGMKMNVPGQPPMAMTMKMHQGTEMRPASASPPGGPRSK